jgi:hypothetical protein
VQDKTADKEDRVTAAEVCSIQAGKCVTSSPLLYNFPVGEEGSLERIQNGSGWGEGKGRLHMKSQSEWKSRI